MRVLHTADLHLGLTRYGRPNALGGNSRIDDFGRTLSQFVEAAEREQVDLAIFAGDIYHTRRPGPQELHLFSRAVRDLSRAGVTTIIVPGNHDGPSTVGDWRTNTLRYLSALGLPNVWLFLRPNDEVVTTRSGPARVVGLPYPHKRAFDEVLAHLSPDERVMESARRYEDIIRSLSVQQDRSMPNIAVGHMTVAGSKTSTEAIMRIGWDVTVGAEAFDNFDLAALGHIHRQQSIGPKVFYPGSPDFMDFGEAGNPKGFMLYEVEPGKDPVASVVPVDVRAMLDITFDGATRKWVKPAETPADSIVRLVITLPEPDPARVAKVVDGVRTALKPSFLKVDVRLPERAAARTESGIDSDLDTIESLRRWLVSQGHPEEPALTAGRELVASLAE